MQNNAVELGQNKQHAWTYLIFCKQNATVKTEMPLLGDNKAIHKASLTFLEGHMANQSLQPSLPAQCGLRHFQNISMNMSEHSEIGTMCLNTTIIHKELFNGYTHKMSI